MKIISNSSPLINFSCLNRLDILKTLYGNITIPQAVYSEITRSGNDHYGVDEFQNCEWINVVPVNNRNLVSALSIELDWGESEVLALANETENALVLMDEKIGRLVAGRLNVKVIGTIGIIIEAKQRGLISNLKDSIDALIRDNGFRISHALYQKIINQKF